MDIRAALIGYFGAGLIRCIGLTMRWKCEGLDNLSTTPRMFAFWHAEQVMMPHVFNKFIIRRTKRKLAAIASRHSDGRIMAYALSTYGIQSVAGSSTRGGAMAVRGLLKKTAEGKDLAMAPDGPKGPEFVAKEGVLHIMRESGLLLQPVAVSVTNGWYLKTWDKMFIPKPFSVGVFVVGTPVAVDEQFPLSEVNEAISAASKRARELCR